MTLISIILIVSLSIVVVSRHRRHCVRRAQQIWFHCGTAVWHIGSGTWSRRSARVHGGCVERSLFFYRFSEFEFFWFLIFFFFVKAVNSVMALPGVRANKTKLLFKLKTAHDIFFLDQVCLLLFSFNHFKFIEIDAQIKGVGSVSWCDFESIAINIVDSYRTSGTVAKTSKLLWIYLIFTNIFNIDWCNVCRWQHVAMR